jgi:hypothetical protein
MDLPLSIKIFPREECQGRDSDVVHLIEASVCVVTAGGRSLQAASISSLCRVDTYADRDCTLEAFDAINGLV